jgi:hypothetical protein
MEQTYCIIRYYRDYNHPDNKKVIASGLSLEDARAHCNDPENCNHGVSFDSPGQWFDGYEEE